MNEYLKIKKQQSKNKNLKEKKVFSQKSSTNLTEKKSEISDIDPHIHVEDTDGGFVDSNV